MFIDITKLITNMVDVIEIDEEFVIDDELLTTTSIKKLENTRFIGKLSSVEFGLMLSGRIIGKMVLTDDITLADVEYNFDINIEEDVQEIFKIKKNIINLIDYLWQNILVEVPLKVRIDNNNVDIKGDGWRLITEEEFNNKSNKPFSELSKLLDEERSD